MILHEKKFSYSAVIAQTTQVDAQTEYSICVTPFCSTMLQTPPLFLVFMITKITMGCSVENRNGYEQHCRSDIAVVCVNFYAAKLCITMRTVTQCI